MDSIACARRLSENRKPIAEKPTLASFSDHFRLIEQLFALNDQKNCLKMGSPRYGFYSRTVS